MPFSLKFQGKNQQNASAMKSAKGKIGEKAVCSPCCGDETTTYHDRAFFIMSVSILPLHNDNKLHIISKNERSQFPVSLTYTMDAQNVRPYALKRPFQRKRLPIYFLKFQINDQWYTSEAPPRKREEKAVFSSCSGDETTVCTDGTYKKWLCHSMRLFHPTVWWKYSLFLLFSPWRNLWLRHFAGYSFETSRKKASTIF